MFQPKKRLPIQQTEQHFQYQLTNSSFERPASTTSAQCARPSQKRPKETLGKVEENKSHSGGSQASVNSFGSNVCKLAQESHEMDDDSHSATNPQLVARKTRPSHVRLVDGGLRYIKELPCESLLSNTPASQLGSEATYVLRSPSDDYLKRVLKRFQMSEPRVACFNQQIKLQSENRSLSGDAQSDGQAVALSGSEHQKMPPFLVHDFVDRLKLGMLRSDLRTLLNSSLSMGELCEQEGPA